MGAREIVIHSEKCVGCLTCQMRCSFLKDGIFNPLASRLEVTRLPIGERLVRFKPDCDHCGVCANFCAYGALELAK